MAQNTDNPQPAKSWRELENEKTTDQLLENDRFEAINDLYRLSTNYDFGQNPFTLFLDLIGWTDEELGTTLTDLAKLRLGYLELWHLGEALSLVGNLGLDAYEHAGRLVEAETRESAEQAAKAFERYQQGKK